MPTAKVQLPNGKTVTMEVPQGASNEDIMQFAYDNYSSSAPTPTVANGGASPSSFNPTAGMSGVEKFLAGVGQGMTSIGRGIGQRSGLISQKEINESMRLDAPLLSTGAGKIGSIAGNVALGVPTAFIPGANTLGGAAALGGLFGASQPTTEGESPWINTAIGTLLGGGLHGGAQLLSSKLAKNAAAKQIAKSQNAVRDAAITEAKKSGFVIPPASANPTVMNRALEGLSGKIATAQAASVKNQPIINQLARKSIGLPEDEPLTTQALDAIRKKAGQAYESIKSLGKISADKNYADDLNRLGAEYKAMIAEFPKLANKKMNNLLETLDRHELSSDGALALLKKFRSAATTGFRQAKTGNASPEVLEMARAHRAAADSLESLMERNLAATGNSQVLNNFRNARKLIAKTYSAEGALNEGTGNIVASKLGRQIGKKPLTKELKTIGQFSKNFPRATQEISDSGFLSKPGLSPLDYLSAMGAGLKTGNPLAAVATLGARPTARALLLSKPYQKLFTNPNYEESWVSKAIRGAVKNPRIMRGTQAALPPIVITRGNDGRDQK